MELKKVIYKVEGRHAVVTMNYPKNMNALDVEMATELIHALTLAQNDDKVKAILINSSDVRSYSAGGDVFAMYQSLKVKDPTIKDLLVAVCDLALLLKRIPKPVVAAVSGVAAGAGFNFALGADIIVANESAKFIQAFVGVGLIPDTGGMYLLTRAVGVNKAVELALTGKVVDANEAKRLGFVSEVYGNEELNDAALKLVQKLSFGPSMSYKYIKELSYEAQFKDFEAYMKKEAFAQNACSESDDALEAMGAFLEKRRPNFK